jgi:hypothetical protein
MDKVQKTTFTEEILILQQEAKSKLRILLPWLSAWLTHMKVKMKQH